MTITEFLLARYAEDEAAARRIDPSFEVNPVQEFVGDRTWLDKPWALDVTEFEHAPIWGVLIQAQRVLGECEAKRNVITAAWDDHVRIEGEWGMCQSREQMDAKGDVPDVIAHLAAVYAAHPDYRDEWRP